MPQIELDAIDRRIIAILQAEGRISNLDLAERIGLSPDPLQPEAEAARGKRRHRGLRRADQPGCAWPRHQRYRHGPARPAIAR